MRIRPLVNYPGLMVLIMVFIGCAPVAEAKPSLAGRVNLHLVTDEAEAVLAILAKKKLNSAITEEDWRTLFASEGYVRLKRREASFKRDFTDEDFKAFVLSDKLAQQGPVLAETLAAWKRAILDAAAKRALAYLPADAHIQAKIYPVIKPRENSFVFEVNTDPAIFLFLNPATTKQQFENTIAHEFHHIGYSTSCPRKDVAADIAQRPKNVQQLMQWMSAFGEGFAMLAAAGGPNIHPHRFSKPEDRDRWDRDVANYPNDLKKVEQFFLDILAGKLSEDEKQKIGFSFFGVQGPWYTVGWKMATLIEKTFGRAKLLECMCDQRKLLATYNLAATRNNQKKGEPLPLWSEVLVDATRGP